MALAHSANPDGHSQDLDEHLSHVAKTASDFARPWGAAELAAVAGWLHDIGKFNPAFQDYLNVDRTAPHAAKRGPDHKGAGAVLAAQMHLDPLCFLIQGHHGGLHARSDVKEWVAERQNDPAVREAIATALQHLPQLDATLRAAAALPPPATLNAKGTPPTALDLYVRMLFSALVDADFLDTERHFQVQRGERRTTGVSIGELWQAFEANQQALSGQRTDWVNQLRHEVYTVSLTHAVDAPGFFRLTGPTGIGKTRLSLGFALRHALTHGLSRVIYAIPYTSITEQVAGEFRSIFQNYPHAVLEYHSAMRTPDPVETPNRNEEWARLAAENWDAPIVVTTTVQLFQSLFSASTGSCRKLHHVARSVIVLDETQMLPPHVLEPILDVLTQLVSHYGATVIFCTATQPALDAQLERYGLSSVREIVPEPQRLFAQLKRVEYTLPRPGERWSWEETATVMRERPQALAIVNTRANAVALLDAMRVQVGEYDARHIFHLSTWMCGAHRQATLQEVRRRLAENEPCWLVSTQVVEAGVDLDFPLVLRALGPLDRIVQAAGRCNRNGRMPHPGRVIVFVPEEGKMPRGVYGVGNDETVTFLQESEPDLHDPTLYERYFRAFYSRVDLDVRHIQQARAANRLDYPEVERSFRMIEEDTVPVAITASNVPALRGNPAHWILKLLSRRQGNARNLWRRLQPYTVALQRHQLAQAQQRGLVQEVLPGLYQWLGQYDTIGGILLESGFDSSNLIQ